MVLGPDPDRDEEALLRLLARTRVPARRRLELAPAELEYLRAVSHGLTAVEVAQLFGVRRDTVQGALARARRVLAAKTLPHAVALAFRAGLLE